MTWRLAGQELQSRLLLGTAEYPTLAIMEQAIKASAAEVVTVSLGRQNPQQGGGNDFWNIIKNLGCRVLPNTAGCHTAQHAITMAKMAREIFQTSWIKVEVYGDRYNLQPDPFALLETCSELIKDGFQVLPYCTDDLVLCQRLVDVGCEVVMPWASPIGSGQGLLNPFALQTLRQRLPHTTLIVDAGIRTPADAVQAMELGFDGVLLNSAVALANDPIKMASAFNHAVTAGRLAYEAGIMPKRDTANASTPLLDTPFWHQTKITI